MSRGKKLLIVGVVLLIGVGLAWPFRKTANEQDREAQIAAPTAPVSTLATTRPRQQSSPALPDSDPHVVAKIVGTGDSGNSGNPNAATHGFDLADHPALAGGGKSRVAISSPVTPAVPPAPQQQARQGYFPGNIQRTPPRALPANVTSSTPNRLPDHPAEVRHVVQNSDTLERLAKRYLGDESRALEIFDLNRDILDNPHLLPIDAELRIPVAPERMID